MPNKGCLLPLKKMEKDMLVFKENIDSWIKQIRAEFNQITDVSCVVEENVNNIQHNYELVHELKEQMEDLRKELNALKLIQIISLRNKVGSKH
jgi:coenzyme F420-reducing hydrogenase gamma subunit